MEADFWHAKWEKKEIGFHLSEANPLLVNNMKSLALDKGSHVFVPLCGKTLDIAWLLSQGYEVVGAELNQTAVEELFESLNIEPEISELGSLKLYAAPDIDIFVGDFFEMTSALLHRVDAVYDRAALIALPLEMRQKYVMHLMQLTGNAPQLLISLEYDQALVAGPPFSLSEEEIRGHYDAQYQLSVLESLEMDDGLKGKYPAKETVWLLSQK